MKFHNPSTVVLCMLIGACGYDTPGSSPAENLAPTISTITDQNTMANGLSQPIDFSVSDEQVENLVLGLTTDNQALLPNENLTISGSGRNRSLTVLPVPDSVGDALVTILVTDSLGLSSSSTFLVTVIPEHLSIQQFARIHFVEAEDDEPALVNAVNFAQDADEDEFDDLLAN